MLLDPFGFYLKSTQAMEKGGSTKDKETETANKQAEIGTANIPALSEDINMMKTYDHIAQFEACPSYITSTTNKRPRTTETMVPFNVMPTGGYHLEQDVIESQAPGKRSKLPKKGSVISPEDREPPNEEELAFFEEQRSILHNLLAYNMPYLAFFPQHLWKQAFLDAICTQTAIISSTVNHMHPVGIKQEFEASAMFYDEFLLEPSNEQDPLINLTFAPESLMPTIPMQTRQRRRSSVRILNRAPGSSTGMISSPGISILELMSPNLSATLRREISNLTSFQKCLARYKCREVFGFYKLMLRNPKASKLTSAQLMENSSRYVVRTILNWAREFYNNQGYFNKSKIGKHKRVSLFADLDFQQALINYAAEQGSAISVDSASAFIKDYHRKRVAETNENLPGPPSSRATVHRWLKLLDIKLGPRGKKKQNRG